MPAAIRSASAPRTAARSSVVLVVAPDALAGQVESALKAAAIAPEVARPAVAGDDLDRAPVLFVVEHSDEVDWDALTCSPDRDFVVLEHVASDLAVRVAALAERDARRRARLADAERLRAETMRMVSRMHLAPTPTDATRIVHDALAELFAPQALVVAHFGDGDGVDDDQPAGWSDGGRLTAEQIAALRRVLTAELAQVPDEGVAVHDGDEAWWLELVGRPAQRLTLVPVADGRVDGVLVLADAADRRRTSFEKSLLNYVGRQLALAIGELHLLERQQRVEHQLAETSGELQRLLDEKDDLGVIIRSIADAVNVGVMFYDTENRPTLHNRMVQEFLQLTGYDPATGLSKHVYASDRRTPVKQGKNIVSETLEGDQRGLIYWIGDPAGEQRAIVTEAHRIVRPDGEPLGSAVVTYDITDLANAIEIREEYLATVSHELRTPLTSIVGYLDLIADSHDVDALGVGNEFRIIQRNAEQMLELIRDLLSTSTRDLSLRIEPADLNALLTQSASKFRPAVAAREHRLELELPQPALIAHLDAGRVTQVVDNLISNAVKYTPAGGLITVALERDGEEAVISVTDSGPGISQADKARLFDRFFRSREAREGAVQGAGIGLTIVKTIVEAHAGTVDVHSTVGHGSTFTVRLPLRAEGTPLPSLPPAP
ncbi:sensor histidine kinase [Gryllotalpicola ginsengisoli]|uniref:sensor histidine kinase n=1 Tax=Gryllotalpicola ginsengisoli TaxID=444608 RepID=UPI000413752D|nr:ATP-binding protein [Gryllotalpicola ginsengisoli]